MYTLLNFAIIVLFAFVLFLSCFCGRREISRLGGVSDILNWCGFLADPPSVVEDDPVILGRGRYGSGIRDKWKRSYGQPHCSSNLHLTTRHETPTFLISVM